MMLVPARQGHPDTRRATAMAGFTLIEILVVLFIISIVTTVTLLTIGRNENRDIENFAKELTQMVSLAEEQAMLEPNVLGISLAPHSVQFASLTKDKETQKSVWLPMEDHVLGGYEIPSNIQVSLQVGGMQVELSKSMKSIPQIIISTNGDVTPFVMYVGKKGKKPQFAITADADGNVSNTALT
jgi:general secretion pathway protein H